MLRLLAFTVLLTGSLLSGSAALAAEPARTSTRIDAVERRAQGERVLVNLSHLCPAGSTIKVEVTVTSVDGTRIAQGTRRKSADCTGDWAPLELRVPRDPAGGVFRAGPATARTVRTVCDAAGCVTVPFDETIRIS